MNHNIDKCRGLLLALIIIEWNKIPKCEVLTKANTILSAVKTLQKYKFILHFTCL